MSKGRQQKWICLDCKAEFSVQGNRPNLCCSCGSVNIRHAPSYSLALTFEQKKRELVEVCERLNPVYEQYVELKKEYDIIMSYWKQQKQRGYISVEEYQSLAKTFKCSRDKDKNNG